MSCSDCVHGAFKPTIYCNACTYGGNAAVYKKEIVMGCLDNGSNCGACGCSKIEESSIIKGHINIYDVGGLYQANSAIYGNEIKAIETGKMVKGYIGTVFISLPIKPIKGSIE